MASFNELLKDIAGQVKRYFGGTADELKFQEPFKFKRKANEDEYKFNLKLTETFDSAKSAAEKTNLEKVKSDLAECEKLLVERQKRIRLADKSKYGWSTVEK